MDRGAWQAMVHRVPEELAETIIIQDRYFKRTIFQFLIPLKDSCLKQQQECIMGLITISSRNKIYESSRAGKEGGKRE